MPLPTAHDNAAAHLPADTAAPAPLQPPDLLAPHPAEHARFVQRVRRRYPSELALLPPGAPVHATLRQGLDALLASGLALPAALRVLRHLVLERLAVLDCEQAADLSVVTRAITELAELALDQACTLAFAELDALHGMPVVGDESAHPEAPVRAQMWVVGMGKLGARELNVSSDIDLVYVYDHDGQTAGNTEGLRRISNHEYFSKAVKHIYATVGETTDHGCVFRVDLALRPNGNSGQSVTSLNALENYFLVQGREWERFAWLKSRVVAPLAGIQSGAARELRTAVLPFVFRRYLDYSVFDALRTLHRQIREHAAKRAAGNPGRANDVKLSRGGIREIEFTVQLLQVVRGGQFPELRTRPTLNALERLCQAQLMSRDTADALAAAYQFLRRVEHRIQYLDDQQTHVMPTRDDDLEWIAHTMGEPNLCAFLHRLDAHRETVAEEFDTLLGGATRGDCSGKGCRAKAAARPVVDLAAVLPDLPPGFAQRIAPWCDHPRVQSLRDDARARLGLLVQRTGVWLREGRVSEEAALRMADWIEPLFRRESYLALLQERPAVHERLLRLLGAARWPARYLLKHPGVIDELATPDMLKERFDAGAFEAGLDSRLAALASTGEDDDEELLNILRRAHHAEVFRTLARDLEGELAVEQVADDLSALADAVLRICVRWCWARMKQRHRDTPQFGIVAYGKLGGKELGYGSDLDIVFVYEDDHDNAGEIYGALARKVINWLTVKTDEGDLYEIDTALRPNGNAGLLVTSFETFERYQLQRGSNTAWTWEHQAITRSRFVLWGDGSAPPPNQPSLHERFDAVREAVITAERNASALAEEIRAMRLKVRSAHPVRTELFDVKHSAGGMVDVEFAVQYMVLAHSSKHPELRPNTGNTKLLRLIEQAGLLPPSVGEAAAWAYRTLRLMQHQARLDEAPTQVPKEAVQDAAAAVRQLWLHTLGVEPDRSPATTPQKV